MDGFHSFESRNWELEFIRKLDRCRCFDEYAIDMEGIEKMEMKMEESKKKCASRKKFEELGKSDGN